MREIKHITRVFPFFNTYAFGSLSCPLSHLTRKKLAVEGHLFCLLNTKLYFLTCTAFIVGFPHGSRKHRLRNRGSRNSRKLVDSPTLSCFRLSSFLRRQAGNFMAVPEPGSIWGVFYYLWTLNAMFPQLRPPPTGARLSSTMLAFRKTFKKIQEAKPHTNSCYSPWRICRSLSTTNCRIECNCSSHGYLREMLFEIHFSSYVAKKTEAI